MFAKSGKSTVHIGLVLPDVLGTYGDNGNAQVLLRRLSWRGFPASIVPITIDVAVPESLDIYLLGGGEDSAQSLATDRLAGQHGLRRAVNRGAPMLAVCAGLQVIGREFTLEDHTIRKGLELLDLVTTPAACRAVGEIVTLPATDELTEPLTGFENHRGHSTFGANARPLGRTVRGIGNGDGTDGILQGNIAGTYLHGPVLARNPELADLLLERAIGMSLAPIDLAAVHHLRRERLDAAPRQVRRTLAATAAR
ncbi:MAG: type 1 glutamine amidotransferase [Sciscionella sp.]